MQHSISFIMSIALAAGLLCLMPRTIAFQPNLARRTNQGWKIPETSFQTTIFAAPVVERRNILQLYEKSGDSDDEANDNKGGHEGDSPISYKAMESKKDSQDEESPMFNLDQIILKPIREVISKTVDFMTIFLGVLVTSGLVLNLCGYGYQINRENGLKIDTIENFRSEFQMQKVAQKYAKEYAASHSQPPSPLPK